MPPATTAATVRPNSRASARKSRKWDADGFAKHDPPEDPSGGAGSPESDVGVTGLAVLAFLASGFTPEEGEHRDTLERALSWLVAQQDEESGLIGKKVGHAFLYRHGIAALALCEAHYLSSGAGLEAAAQKAVDCILRARNPGAAWRYDFPPVGDNDTSVTGWMVAALESARQGSLAVDPQAFAGALAWIGQVTDPSTGRIGYDSPGSRSSRVPGVNDRFPVDRTEAMTASGLLSRFLLGQDPAEEEVMNKHADLLLRALPEWSPRGLTNDLYYWYHGSFAMYRMGGRYWDSWNKAMKKTLLEKQKDEGSAAGSWDPDGPWGFAGGRVYSTAMGVICLATYFRHARLYGAR